MTEENAKRIFTVTDSRGEMIRVTAERSQGRDGNLEFWNGNGAGSVEVAAFAAGGWISYIEITPAK